MRKSLCNKWEAGGTSGNTSNSSSISEAKVETEEVGLTHVDGENGKESRKDLNRDGMSGATWTKESLSELPKRGHRNSTRNSET